MQLLGVEQLDDYLTRYQVDGILWVADRLLGHVENLIVKNDRCAQVASLLADFPEDQAVMRDDYLKKICTTYDLKVKTIEKMIADEVQRRSKAETRKVRKNKVKQLKTDPKTFPFFKEVIRQASGGARSLDKIKIDKLKFIELLASFGFSRYAVSGDDGAARAADDFTFVRAAGNVIQSVSRDEIIDHLEHYVRHDYDFDAAKIEFADAEQLLNAFYDQLRTIFSKDLFARVRLDSPIVLMRDKSTITYLYFKNGFVEITSDGYKLNDYKDMDGSVWNTQLKDRQFSVMDNVLELKEYDDDASPGTERPLFKCSFIDFCYRISGSEEWTEQKIPKRFQSLMCIIGYLVHDFYSYNLKSIYFTDSAVTDHSEGRTGKTLLMKMLGMVRSFCEIHGKNFDPHSDKRYETVTQETQLLHINDVSNKGKNKFEIEPMFNDITEGLHIRALYAKPFRHFVKMAISGNKSLIISGGSAKARLLEFEVSNFFSVDRRPDQFYGHWFGRDWDNDQWNQFDNFIAVCAQMFHVHGLMEPPVVNLPERKLRDHTSPEFIDFMQELMDAFKAGGIAVRSGKPWETYQEKTGSRNEKMQYDDITEFAFDKRQLFDYFIKQNKDFDNKFFTVRKFNSWLAMFSEYRLNVRRPMEWKSNGLAFLRFTPEN